MLLIPCPWCGARSEDEFLNGGEAGKRRPADPAQAGSEEWYRYLYTPANTKGWLRERWWHVRGCRRWFKVDRNTHTHEIKQVEEADQWR